MRITDEFVMRNAEFGINDGLCPYPLYLLSWLSVKTRNFTVQLVGDDAHIVPIAATQRGLPKNDNQ